jgi:transcriptional regulator with XRE-family HTH domain
LLKGEINMENPLTAIRQQKDLTVSEMAILSGVSYMTIERLERGDIKKITPRVLISLEKWGYSKERLVADYEAWKVYRIKQLEEKLV